MNAFGHGRSRSRWLLTPATAGATTVLLLAVLAVAPRAQDVQGLKAGVVRVTATSREGGKQKVGTGFVVKGGVDADYVVTAAHVIEGAEVEVEFFTLRNRPVKARVVQMEGGDPQGIAALLVDGRVPAGVSPLRMAGSLPVRDGEPVLTIGFPRPSNEPWAVITGTVRGRAGRTITFAGAVDEGSSGAPLIKEGVVVGVVTHVANQVGLAVPAGIAQYVLENWGIETKTGELDNTRIAFVIGDGIFLMKPDGSDVQRLNAGWGYHLSWAPDGSRIALTSTAGDLRGIAIMRANGEDRKLIFADERAAYPSWSPDGRKIAFSVSQKGIYVMSDHGADVRPLTNALTKPEWDSSPSWSPDGGKIAFHSGSQVYVMNLDGSAPGRLTSEGSNIWPKWSPDGTRIAFQSDRDRTAKQIYVMDANGGNERRVTNLPKGAYEFSWSPDSTKIAFQAGGDAIYSVTLATGEATRLIHGASAPSWSPFLNK